MGKGKSKAPSSPDPRQTASAQDGSSFFTALMNSYLGNANQYGPGGSIEYRTDGYETVTNPYTGQTYQVPRRSVHTNLSPEEQAIYNQTQGARGNVAGLANQLSALLGGNYNQPFSIDNEATEARLFELGSKRLDPMFEQRRSALSQRLADQGIAIGSEAYNNAMNQFGQSQNDAYNQLALQGRQQAVSELLAERNQPLAELQALLGFSPVQGPQAQGYNASQMPTTDVAGLINSNYQNQLNAYNQNQANKQGMIGAGLQAAGKLLPLLSDRRAKKNIKKTGIKMGNGLNLYSYEYKDGKGTPGQKVGVMAQDVEKVMPEAVTEVNGEKRVNLNQVFA